MQFKDYYAVLGVSPQATLQEIKAAYRQLARKFHPDVNPGDQAAEQKFAEINEAYEVLGDDEERKKFDEISAYVRSGEAHKPPPQPHYYDAHDLEDLLGQEGVGQGSFFEHFFGRRQSRAAPRQGADLHALVEISLQEAHSGPTRRLTMERLELCLDCSGSGMQGKKVCPSCRGLGQVRGPHTLEVKIPAGVTQGSTIRLRGQGQAGSAGGPRGDLLLTVELASDPVYRVEGHDLHRDVEVSIFTAVLGGEVAFQGVKGRLNLRIAPETQNGAVLRLRGQGLPRSGQGTPGDLYARVSLRIPTGLGEAQKEQFRQLRDGLEPVRS